jgi:hypothetical protein
VTARSTFGVAALLWLFLSMTIALQTWVGDRTIYAAELEQRRADLHQAILDNRPPGGGTWAAIGAQSIQKRVAVVYLAENIRKLTAWTIGKVYKLLDTVFLFGSFVALFVYLKKWLPTSYSLIGVLYFGAALHMTYLFQLFHPWDRLQVLLWIVLLFLVAERQFFLLMVVLALSVLVKFDTVLLPFFYFAVHLRHEGRIRLVLESLTLLLIAWGINAWLSHAFPDPMDVSRFSAAAVSAIFLKNLDKMAMFGPKYPPLLVHLLPLALALFGLLARERFVWMSVCFAVALSMVHLLLTNYEEVRAHLMVLILVAPAALMSVRSLIEPQPADKTT